MCQSARPSHAAYPGLRRGAEQAQTRSFPLFSGFTASLDTSAPGLSKVTAARFVKSAAEKKARAASLKFPQNQTIQGGSSSSDSGWAIKNAYA